MAEECGIFALKMSLLSMQRLVQRIGKRITESFIIAQNHFNYSDDHFP
jgi:hypothetical protein